MHRSRAQFTAVVIVCFIVAGAAYAAYRSTNSSDGKAVNQPRLQTYERSVALTLPYGDGASGVGSVQDAPEQRPYGPESFAVDGANIFILDSVHARVLEFDANAKLRRTIDNVPGLDLAVRGSEVFVLDPARQLLTAISSDDKRTEYQEARGAQFDRITTDMLPSSPGTPQVRGESASTSQTADSSNGFDVTQVNSTTAMLSNASGLKITVVTPRMLGSVNVVGIDQQGNVYVAVEQLGAGTTVDVTAELRKYTSTGRLVAVLPDTAVVATHPHRAYLVTPEGAVYHLVPERHALIVEKWQTQ